MAEYRYLIVGGGMTGDAAAKGIREVDRDGSIGLVGEEQHPPYARPPLSKGLWQGKEESSIWRRTDEHDVDLRLGRRIVSLDLAARGATDDAGETHTYERLLLATGGTPRRLPDSPDGVVYFRTLDDYRHLHAEAPGKRVVVVGGGFIGSEIAAALTTVDARPTLVFPDAGIGGKLFPTALAAALNEKYRSHGVEVVPLARVHGVERTPDGYRVALEDGRTLEADLVVAGLGIEPRTDLAQEAGLPVDDGIVVDEHGRLAGWDGVFAAGDVARFPEAVVGRTRVEHEDHAKSHGKSVGRNMAGADEPYDHLPFFYSDLFDAGYEAVGDVSSRHETLEEWAEPNRKGVVAYLDGERRPRGFLLWDVWGKVGAATALIRAGEPVDAAALRELIG
jgi:3-phenylpropionate/trans-cinnamate dioxygenase ferredoxin reductase subunit